MILMIDNYDSFTYNIVQYCLELGADLRVKRNDEVSISDITLLKPEKILISPGPSTPDEAGISLEIIDFFKMRAIPILGICLGHQTIAQSFGASIVRARNLMHGKTSQIQVSDHATPLFHNIPEKFTATRYHSLVVHQESMPDALIPTAYSQDDNELMALEVKDCPIYGVQFHPESIMSEYGYEILDNFLKL
jgi:anthranilate synthase component II